MKKLIIKNLTRRQKNFLTLAAAIGFAFPACQVAASQTEYVCHDGKEMIQMEFFDEGEFTSEYTLDSSLIDATKSATAYWTGILGPRSKFSSAWQILVSTQKNFQNAFASSYAFKDKEESGRNFIAEMLQGNRNLVNLDLKSFATAEGKDEEEKIKNTIPDGVVGLSLVVIGQHLGANRDGVIDGWAVDTDTVLPTNEQAADFIGAFRHELGHTLGIVPAIKHTDAAGNVTEDTITATDGTVYMKFADDVKNSYSWNMHLVDENLNPAKAGMRIITPETFSELQAKNPDIKQSDYFIVSQKPNLNNPTSGYAYFIGDNVTAVLDGATFSGVSGLPINGWEEYNHTQKNTSFEGGHLQTAGMMSHRSYSNYTGFMEVELAVMQDLGYDIDRKLYYGRSIYGNDLTVDNTTGYGKRSILGTYYLPNTYSQIPLGVGLHVYGSRNTVTQSGNILTQGTGAVGIRVDGYGNTINIPDSTEIHADGYRGKGVLIAYGRNQNLNQSGIVTATGQGGNAIEFNFGSSANGALDEYRGSYIRYKRDVDALTGNIISAENDNLTDMDISQYNVRADELDGALVDNFNLSGTITGGENAIYIGKNALVKNINVNAGAEINGNIKSDWKNFSESDGIFSSYKTVAYTEKSKDDNGNEIEEETGETEPLKIQYNGTKYAYTFYIPDLTTNLNFNADMIYSGDITGTNNMKLYINSGTTTYTGSADVLNVTVANGASLFGGTYTVNDMSEKIAEGFSDDTTGKFINHGTVGAASADSIMTINGDFVSDGTLQAVGGGSGGYIKVSGDSDIDSSIVTVKNALPGETNLVLTANSITGTATAYESERVVEVSALMNASGKIEGDKLTITTSAANNLGELTSDESETLNAVSKINSALSNSGDSRINEMRTIYNLDPDDTKKSLNEISTEDSVNTLNLVQKNTVVDKVISDRLNKVFAATQIEVPIMPARFSDGDGEEKSLVKAEIEIPKVERNDNNTWISFGKNWGSLRGDVDYHGKTISGGWDKPFGKNWRGGVFVSYGTMSYGATHSHANIYDTRVGIYSGWRKGANIAYLYFDAGWLRNSLRRGLPTLGLSTDAKYSSHIYEIGGEFRHDLQQNRTWHVMPFINFQASYLKQNGYREKGAGIYNQHVDSKNNTYATGMIGMEFKRYTRSGSYGFRFGVKHGLAGATPNIRFNYEGDSATSYTISGNQDKTHGVFAIKADTEFARNWFIGCDAAFQRGAHDKDISASLTLRRVW